MDTSNEWSLSAAQHYLQRLKDGDPHPIDTLNALRQALSVLDKTLEDLSTDEDEVAQCVLYGRKIAATMFLQYVERDHLDTDVIFHFFAETLRYGTTHHTEVVEFLCEVARECSISLHDFELPSDKFTAFVRSCYCVVAYTFLNSLLEFDDVSWLLKFEAILEEGDMSLEHDLKITRDAIETELKRIYDLWKRIAGEALQHLRSDVPDLQNSPRRHKVLLEMAQLQGGISLPTLENFTGEIGRLFKRSELYDKLRANARNN